MELLNKAQFDEILRDHYLAHYGAEPGDIWYDQPAVNVWVFQRGAQLITLQSHLLTGNVTEQREEMP